MAGLSVKVQLDAAALARLLSGFSAETRAVVRKHGLAVEARARATAPRDTGLLANSHATRMQGNEQTSTALVTASTPYAAAVHDGRRALDIVPKHGQYLRFQAGGRTVYARRVHQQARPGRPWLAEALQAEEAPFRADITALIERP